MPERQPTTQTMKASEARQRWSEILSGVFSGKTRVMVEKSGIPVAAVVSTQDLERLNQLDAQRQERFKVLDRIGEAFRDVPPEEIEQQLAAALAEVRQDRRNTEERAATSK